MIHCGKTRRKGMRGTYQVLLGLAMITVLGDLEVMAGCYPKEATGSCREAQ